MACSRTVLTPSQLTNLPPGTLEKAYTTIQSRLDEVQRYVDIWLQYQALWDMEATTIYNKLGTDLNKWQQLLGKKSFSVTGREVYCVLGCFRVLLLEVFVTCALWCGMVGRLCLSFFSPSTAEIKRARTTFDNSNTRKIFGPIVIDYALVQASVNNKYDYWHKVRLSFCCSCGISLCACHVLWALCVTVCTGELCGSMC